MKNIFVLLSALLGCSTLFSQTPKASVGNIRRIQDFPSSYVMPRTIEVWLPEGYDSTKRYAVLYMHDGQMLFDSTSSWNKQEWGMDEVAQQLINQKRVPPFLIVGVYNTGTYRHAEYFPEKPLQFLEPSLRDTLLKAALMGEARADRYLKFLTEELKPYIDQHFSTYRDAAHTSIMGSSMGGLISLYAICEYPQVFGRAGCLSTHWPGIFTANEPIPNAFNRYLSENAPDPRNHRIYFDFGTATLDALYEPYQIRINATMKRKGFTEKKNWISLKFPGEDHSERAWSKRVAIPLQFLMSHPAGRREK